MIHNSSVIDKKAKISKNVKIGPFCYVGPNVELQEISEFPLFPIFKMIIVPNKELLPF